MCYVYKYIFTLIYYFWASACNIFPGLVQVARFLTQYYFSEPDRLSNNHSQRMVTCGGESQ